MWWSSKLPLAALLLLAACGFQPLYGERGVATASDQLAAIRIQPIPDRSGQVLYNALRDGLNPLGPPASPEYLLRVQLSEDTEGVALRTDETATRVNLTLTAIFALHAGDAKEPLYRGVSRTTTAYNVLDSPYATLTSAEDARARALQDIAREIRGRLAVFLTRQASAN
ncbi:MAG: LPS assembly lipoprotein LptE [Rhodospirillales bacterium]|nr:LPS assembly lipoprotein LptE [Rhodospirillales bacterium]